MKDIGYKKGFEEGINANKLEIAKEMLKSNENIDKIIKYTNLSKEEIENLKKELI